MIPRLIHYIWTGSPIPERFQAFQDGWRELHPNWRVVYWTDRSLAYELPISTPANVHLFNRAHEHTERVGQLRSDILRYEILRTCGGVYVDLDMECLKPIDELVEDVEGVEGCFFGWEKQDTWIGNTIIGCQPLHPFINLLCEGVAGSVRANAGRYPNRMSGPQYVTRQYRTRAPGAGKVRVFPEGHFYPYAWNELERGHETFPEAYTVHHWDNQRKIRGMPL